MARFLVRLRTLLAVLLSRPIPVRIRGAVGAKGHFHPGSNLVLPEMAGADDGDGDGNGDGDGGSGAGGDGDGNEGGEGDGDGDGDGDGGKVSPDDDWKAKARKHETGRKKAEREAREAREALKKREDADKSESQKAIDQAKEEGRKEALTEAEKERRADRLEVAVTRLASKGIKLGEGDEAKTVRFADSEDALLHVERAIDRGEIDAEDIYDGEGRVKPDSLTSELERLLERKPHLQAGDGEKPKPGDPDTRKGDPAKSDLESMTPEDHAKRKYGKDN